MPPAYCRLPTRSIRTKTKHVRIGHPRNGTPIRDKKRVESSRERRRSRVRVNRSSNRRFFLRFTTGSNRQNKGLQQNARPRPRRRTRSVARARISRAFVDEALRRVGPGRPKSGRGRRMEGAHTWPESATPRVAAVSAEKQAGGSKPTGVTREKIGFAWLEGSEESAIFIDGGLAARGR